jgi:hypothetical protein
MTPYGLNGHWHYSDCRATLNTDPACSCVSSMAKQIAMLQEEIVKLMKANRHLQRVVDNAR